MVGVGVICLGGGRDSVMKPVDPFAEAKVASDVLNNMNCLLLLLRY